MSSGVKVDVNCSHYWSVVRDQGKRPSCMACAVSDAHQFCWSVSKPFSVEYLFFYAAKNMPSGSAHDGLSFSATHDALSLNGQPLEKEWPYQLSQPSPWVPPSVTECWTGNICSNGHAVGDIVHVLKAGEPVVLGLQLTNFWLDELQEPYVIPADGKGFGRHAVLAVGVGEYKTEGQVLLVRNSWGGQWGNDGNAWLAADYLVDKLIGFGRVKPKLTRT